MALCAMGWSSRRGLADFENTSGMQTHSWRDGLGESVPSCVHKVAAVCRSGGLALPATQLPLERSEVEVDRLIHKSLALEIEHARHAEIHSPAPREDACPHYPVRAGQPTLHDHGPVCVVHDQRLEVEIWERAHQPPDQLANGRSRR